MRHILDFASTPTHHHFVAPSTTVLHFRFSGPCHGACATTPLRHFSGHASKGALAQKLSKRTKKC